MQYPNYNRSLLSIASSVLVHYGAESLHPTLQEFDILLAKNYKNVVVMLFDGLGTAILEKHLSEKAFLRRYLKSTISSVFPPTTTAATISIETGLSPIEHGWLGWSLYFDEINSNVNIFPNTFSGTNGQPASDYHVARKYIPYKSIFTKIRDTGKAEAFCVSPFSEYRSKSIPDICNTVKLLCEKDGNKYIYTYWHQPDFDMHDFGTTHKNVTSDIMNINKDVETLCNSLSDTLVIITADHGLVDTEWMFISDYPDIIECFEHMPSIESRAMTFFVKPEKKHKFESIFIKHFGNYYKLLTKQEALSSGLFGDGFPHPRCNGFIGDYLAVATGNISIECTPSVQHDLFKAAHAGITDDEMNVPFIVFECAK